MKNLIDENTEPENLPAAKQPKKDNSPLMALVFFILFTLAMLLIAQLNKSKDENSN